MHIAYVHRGYFPAVAGAENMARIYASLMRERGHDVTLVMYRPGATATQWFEADGVRRVNIARADPNLLARALVEPVDVLHAVDLVWTDFPAAAAEVARRQRTAFVVTPASTPRVWHDVDGGLALCRSADAVCVLTSTEAATFVAAGIPAERLTVLGQGPLLTEAPAETDFRECHRIPPEAPVVLFLGRKAAFKGYRELLACAPYVWQQHPETRFVFAGPPWDADCAEVFRGCADPRVIELGMLSESKKYSAYRACTIFALPTRWDVFPLSILEAWTCERPVIVGRFPGVEEIVRPNIDGLVLEPRPEFLAEAIIALLSSPEARHAFGVAGKARVEQHFNWRVVGNRLADLHAGVYRSSR